MKNNNFFNFTADCTAYLNEVKWVSPKKGDAFIAIKACILEGEEAENKIFIDLIARGKQAIEVLQLLETEWPEGYNSGGDTWFAGLRIGSLSTKPYMGKDGHPKAVLSGRLLAIKHLKIGDESIAVPEWRSNAGQGEESTSQPPQQPSLKPTQPQQPRQQQQTRQQPRQPQRQMRRGAA